jgi:hypothetical protein
LITVVSGLPRSGTSLTMQMLAAGGMALLTDGVRAADADNPRGYFEFEPVKRTKQDASWVAGAEGKAVKVIYALLRDLPAGHEYRVILMRRDLDETIASQREMLRRSGRAGASLTAEQLKAAFQKELATAVEWVRAQGNFRMLEVGHRECVTNPSKVAAEVNAFLGGGLNEQAMAAAVDPGLFRQIVK